MRYLICSFAAAVAVGLFCPSVVADESTPALAYAYRSLVPGEATLEAVLAKLGRSPIETAGDTDLRYPVEGKPWLSDRLYFSGGKLALVSAASPDLRYSTRDAVLATLGKPEAHIEFQTQDYLEYTSQGLRFICTADGEVTGVIYFAEEAACTGGVSE